MNEFLDGQNLTDGAMRVYFGKLAEAVIETTRHSRSAGRPPVGMFLLVHERPGGLLSVDMFPTLDPRPKAHQKGLDQLLKDARKALRSGTVTELRDATTN